MNAHKVEPVLLLSAWPEKLYFPISEGSIQPLVPHVAHAIQCKLSLSLLQQHRLDLNVICFGSTSVVVDKPSCLKQVQSC